MRCRVVRAQLGRSSPSLFDRAAALDGLASLLRAGLTVLAALEEWPDAVPRSVGAELRDASRLVALGAPLPRALDPAAGLLGSDLDAVHVALELSLEMGVDPIPLLTRPSTLIRARAEEDAAGRSSAAGARLSGAMVGGLPLVALPLLPMAHAPILDAAGAPLLFLGLILTVAGLVWIHHLIPRPVRGDEPVAAFLDHLAAAFRAGAPLAVAFDVTSRLATGPLAQELEGVGKRTALGQPLAEALDAADPIGLGSTAAVLRRADRLGTAPAAGLEALAEARRAAARHRFDREMRRAPVLMVLPLVLCVLPAFGLLAIVPFLRGIAFG